MKQPATFLATLLLAAAAFSAESSNESLDIATELVSAMKISETIAGMREGCDQALPNANWDPKRVLERYPRAFNGLTPSSEFWSEIEEAYKTYRIAQCDLPGYDKFVQIAVAEYAQSLSVEELKQMLTFYQSELGKAFVLASRKANFALQSQTSEMAIEHQRLSAIYKKQAKSEDKKICKANKQTVKKKR
jgi:hypothetical protein